VHLAVPICVDDGLRCRVRKKGQVVGIVSDLGEWVGWGEWVGRWASESE
jgi:hypothetical protein